MNEGELFFSQRPVGPTGSFLVDDDGDTAPDHLELPIPVEHSGDPAEHFSILDGVHFGTNPWNVSGMF